MPFKPAYKQKKLAYKRAKTDAMLRLTFPNGERWDVPAQVVADSRDENYADDKEDTVKFIRQGSLDPYDLMDWAANNMNWSDLLPWAVKVAEPEAIDHEEEYGNAAKSIEGEL